MAEDEPKSAADAGDDLPEIVIPARQPLPLPPEVTYTRPTLGQTPAPRQNQTQGADEGESSPHSPSGVAAHGAGMAAGITSVSSIAGGALLGTVIDGHWNHSQTPWATILLTLFGAVAGFLNMQRLLSRSDRDRPKK